MVYFKALSQKNNYPNRQLSKHKLQLLRLSQPYKFGREFYSILMWLYLDLALGSTNMGDNSTIPRKKN